jgi:hypothetical protein
MTIIFGRLVDEFNDFGRGKIPPDRLQDAVNTNAYVFSQTNLSVGGGVLISHLQLVVSLSLHWQVYCQCCDASKEKYAIFVLTIAITVRLHTYDRLHHHRNQGFPSSPARVHSLSSASGHRILRHLHSRICGHQYLQQR